MLKNKVSELSPAVYNPRKISKKQLEYLKKSMIEFGDLSGIVVNAQSGQVIGGHQRIKNLEPEWQIFSRPETDNTGTIELGYVETPWGRISYRLVDWPIEKEKAANLAANKHGGEWDMPKLNLVIEDLKEIDFDLSLTGFDPGEFKFSDDDLSDIYDVKKGLGGIKYQVVVECSGEYEQIDLIQQLEAKGYSCHPLIL